MQYTTTRPDVSKQFIPLIGVIVSWNSVFGTYSTICSKLTPAPASTPTHDTKEAKQARPQCWGHVWNESNNHCYLLYRKHDPTADINTFNATAYI